MSVSKSKSKKSCWEQFKFHLTPNMTFLPLKCTIFFYACSAIAMLPYLTVHMKDIGISIEHIAIIYAVLPFTALVSSPLMGFLADKLGSYTKVLIFCLIGDAIFFTLLLAVPEVHNQQVPLVDNATASWSEGSKVLLESSCPVQEIGKECLFQAVNYTSIDISLSSCLLSHCSSVSPDDLCSVFVDSSSFCSQPVNSTDSLLLANVTFYPDGTDCMQQAGRLWDASGSLVQLRARCELSCSVIDTEELTQCSDTVTVGNRTLTNVLYFIFRALGTMCLACNFQLIDAQTLSMCRGQDAMNEENEDEKKKMNKKEKEAQGDDSDSEIELGMGEAKPQGSLGRQYVMMGIAAVVIAPLTGKIMDVVTQSTGKPSYAVPLLINAGFLVLTVVMVCCIKLDMNLPKAKGLRGLKKIFTNADIIMFLIMMFALGMLWGFVETFLFVYLKDDMDATMLLLGLTITVGALTSIPCLYFADWFIKKLGRENVLILALGIYAIRYIGYSFITNPWMAFPFEALEVFTNTLMRIAAIDYTGKVAPKGLLATLNGLVGGLHYGVGKGAGSLLGGAIIAATGSTSSSFRIFGYLSVALTVVYIVYIYGISRRCLTKNTAEKTSKDATFDSSLEKQDLAQSAKETVV